MTSSSSSATPPYDCSNPTGYSSSCIGLGGFFLAIFKSKDGYWHPYLKGPKGCEPGYYIPGKFQISGQIGVDGECRFFCCWPENTSSSSFV